MRAKRKCSKVKSSLAGDQEVKASIGVESASDLSPPTVGDRPSRARAVL